MPRQVRDSALETRTARSRLKTQHKPYFRLIEPGLHLGFRKLPSGPGTWVLRRYLGGGAYSTENLRTRDGEFTIADDFGDGDGVKVLTFAQAQDRARERARAVDEQDRIASLGPALTVRGAVEAYIEARERREAAVGGYKSRAKHVLRDEALAAKPLAALTTDDLASWREGLTMAPGSARRVVNDLRAALNTAAKRGKESLPPNIRETIKDGLASTHAAPAVAREAQVLPDADVRRIISAAWEVDAEGGWDGDLARLVLVLAATGARFSQAVRMTVADVQAPQRRLMVPVSRKGRGVKNLSHVGVRVGDDILGALAKATAGRKGHEPLFLRPHWRLEAGGLWRKGERGPWRETAELTRRWRAIVARAGLPPATVAYSLRHSSIVRGLRAGLPTRLVAALHDTSVMQVEAHYSAFIVDALDELAARAVIPLTTAPAAVVPLTGRTRQ